MQTFVEITADIMETNINSSNLTNEQIVENLKAAYTVFHILEHLQAIESAVAAQNIVTVKQALKNH